jgi:hypothetical protein
MWVFRSPYSDIATIYCTADVEGRFVTELHLFQEMIIGTRKSFNCNQKWSRRLWSWSDSCCTIWMRYGLNNKRLRRTLQTSVFDIDSSLAAVPVDFFGLCRKLTRTRSAVNGRPLDFCLHRHPVSVNCLYHTRMVLSVGGSFARNARCTVTTNLRVWYSNTQNDFSLGAAIFSLHTLASPSGSNVNYDEKQLTGKRFFSCSFYLYRFCKYVSYGFPIIIFIIPEYIMKRPV